MKCRICDVDKLSREFPREPLTEICAHPALYCLRCVTAKVRIDWKCPYNGCGQKIEEDNPCLKECDETLEFLFPEVSSPDDCGHHDEEAFIGQLDQRIQVTTLTGENESFVYREQKTIRELKKEISLRMRIEIDKQRLIYNGTELKATKTDGTMTRFSDFDIKPFSTMQLMILLYAIPDTLNHVIFDLSWNYPSHGRDFLDASCLIFINDEWYNFIDWRNKGYSPVWHSGDKMDDYKRNGRHRIEAKLKEIPLCVSHLVFTLSSFKSPTIAAFGNPTLKFYDAADVTHDLCNVSFQKAAFSTALIVCCVSRMQNGNWRIDEGGRTSAGSALHYYLLINTIRSLIQSNAFTGVSLAPGKSLIWYMNAEEKRQYEIQCKQRLLPGQKS